MATAWTVAAAPSAKDVDTCSTMMLGTDDMIPGLMYICRLRCADVGDESEPINAEDEKTEADVEYDDDSKLVMTNSEGAAVPLSRAVSILTGSGT